MTVLWIIIALVSTAALLVCMKRLASTDGKLKACEATSSRYVLYYKTLTQWLKNRNKGIKADEFLKIHKMETIAIYGIGEMGQMLFEELKGTGIKVDYFIDRRANDIFSEDMGIKVVGMDGIASEKPVDAIVVTPVYDFNAIEDALYDMDLDTTILSLEDIIYEV